VPTWNDVFQIKQNEKEWRVWYEKEKPEEEDIPCGYNRSLDVFRKLLLVRSWSPDRTLSQSRNYIMGKPPAGDGPPYGMDCRVLLSSADSLGPEYGEACILDLEKTLDESEPRTPLVCVLSVGSDPSPQITALAKSKDIRNRRAPRPARFSTDVCPLQKSGPCPWARAKRHTPET